MSPKLFGILMLLWASAVAGAGYSLRQTEPQVLAEAPVAGGADASSVSSPAPPVQGADPAIRVILPSPYEVRTN